MTHIKVEIDENTLRGLIARHLEAQFGSTFDASKVKIEVKSKQNYKSEWEVAAFRARYEAAI
jgi:hypothetical protein